MVMTFKENGKTKVAVVLGDSWSEDPEEYRKSLFQIIDAAILNKEFFENSCYSGSDIFNCIRLARAMEKTPEEKGGKL